ISGVISGNISGSIHSCGIDTLSGVITNTGATQPVRILGVFPQTGTAGDFEGRIVTEEIPTYATSMEIVGDSLVVSNGGTIELTIAEDALLDPTAVAWSVYVNNTDIASLSDVEAQTGYVTTADGVVTVHGLSEGTATIIAKSIDGSLLQDTITITVDATAPTIGSVSPAEGMLQLQPSGTFIFVVDASDAVGLYELEIDHNMASLEFPEFSLYADSTNVYGDSESATQFATAGVQASYDEAAQRWSIDFGTNITNAIVANHGITIYIVVKDLAGNQFGSMYSVTEDNTFAYTVTRAS
ncbi:MAG: hypothetical protein M0P49_07125, partial [Bacilli bacterium]|nr:hypothetical protein [Bacilli bacterium]